MGSFLGESLGDDYVAIGLAFNEGSFQAIDWTQGKDNSRGLSEHTVGPAPEGSLDAALARSGLPILILDLHKLPPQGPIASWFRAPHLHRQIGAVYFNEARMGFPIVVTDHFDAIAFVNQTTRARPVRKPAAPTAD
jgi:erythromycin esterase